VRSTGGEWKKERKIALYVFVKRKEIVERQLEFRFGNRRTRRSKKISEKLLSIRENDKNTKVLVFCILGFEFGNNRTGCPARVGCCPGNTQGRCR